MQIEATMMPEEYRYKKVLLLHQLFFFVSASILYSLLDFFIIMFFCIFFRYGFCATTATILLKSTST